jgi:glycosyltransferase involved in cell wall biosynthesis
MLGNFGATHEQIHRIPGAFDATEFAYNPRPHAAGEAFVAGRVSRAAPNKFSPRTWGILERVNYHPFQYRVMGWEPAIEKTIGKPPPFAECLPCRAEPVDQFFASLHCYCQLNGAAVENWPRVGLEAMAAGVPIITQAKGGWLEMIEDGHTGFLCASEDEVGQRIDQLATDEDFRLTMAARAYRRLLTVLADQETIAEAWINLFQQMEAKKP